MPLTLTRKKVTEQQTKWVYPNPLTFDEWLEVSGPKDFDELIDGVLVEKTMVQSDHEKLNLWLLHLLDLYATEKKLGITLGTRSPVEISKFRGRMPDLFFVREERKDIVHSKATYGAPDLIIEIISPNDRPSDMRALETDYRSLGVAEIIFVDQKKRRLRVLRRAAADYDIQELTSGPLILTTMGNLAVEWDWIFVEPRPAILATVTRLLTESQPEENDAA